MKLLIHGRNLDVTPALREYTETKLERAIHHFDDLVKEADVHLSVARNPRVPQQTAEVTVFANGTVIRAQERSETFTPASIWSQASWRASCDGLRNATATMAIGPPLLRRMTFFSRNVPQKTHCSKAKKHNSLAQAFGASISPCQR